MRLIILSVLFASIIFDTGAQDNYSQIGEYMATASVLELLGEDFARTFAEKIPIDEQIHWEVYVPENYSPAKPSGILVFINSRNSGKILKPWKNIIEKNNLIWIGANDSGNDISIARRVAYAILAPRLINNIYSIDPDRIYISGFSGGGRIASLVATEYNNLFTGAVFNSGANFWGEAASSRYEEMRANFYVFITGTEDFNLDDTREVHNAYIKAGIENSKLMVIPDMAHERPAAQDLDTAIKYLDSRFAN